MVKIKKKPWLAGLLSFLVIGMGQVYNKKYKEGILLFILAMALNILALNNYWLSVVVIFIWLYSIYDAFKTAKRTINILPCKNAIWITVIILISFFFTGISYVYFSMYYSTYGNYTFILPEKQTEIEKYEEIRQKLLRKGEEFFNKLTEASLSLDAKDFVTARNKISEAKTILIDLKNDYEFSCSFQENNRNLFPNVTDDSIKKCKAYVELYKFCLPKFLDSYYALTYLVEQTQQIKTQEDIENYRNSCNSWLNNYNLVRGSCNTLIEINKLDIKPFEDFSYMCKV